MRNYSIDRQGITRDKYGRPFVFDEKEAAKRRKSRAKYIPRTPLVKLA